MRATFLFLGTGASSGVPMIGCKCKVCQSQDAKNKRLRSAALLTWNNKNLLIDSGPDFRLQALTHQIEHLEGVALTHAHYDHIAGLDELRIFYLRTRQPLPILLSLSTFADIQRRYDYLFRERKSACTSLTAQLDFHILDQPNGEANFCGFKIHYVRYEQAGMQVMGYRFGSLAYLSDIHRFSENIFTSLLGVEILVVSALKQESSLVHFSISEAVAFARKVGAKRTYLMHLGHELEYIETNQWLPQDIQLAYDGLKVDFEYE